MDNNVSISINSNETTIIQDEFFINFLHSYDEPSINQSQTEKIINKNIFKVLKMCMIISMIISMICLSIVLCVVFIHL